MSSSDHPANREDIAQLFLKEALKGILQAYQNLCELKVSMPEPSSMVEWIQEIQTRFLEKKAEETAEAVQFISGKIHGSDSFHVNPALRKDTELQARDTGYNLCLNTFLPDALKPFYQMAKYARYLGENLNQPRDAIVHAASTSLCPDAGEPGAPIAYVHAENTPLFQQIEALLEQLNLYLDNSKGSNELRRMTNSITSISLRKFLSEESGADLEMCPSDDTQTEKFLTFVEKAVSAAYATQSSSLNERRLPPPQFEEAVRAQIAHLERDLRDGGGKSGPGQTGMN